MNAVTVIDFYQDKLTVIDADGEQWIAVRAICEALGLAWKPQFQKLTDPQNAWCVTMMVTQDASNRRQEMVVLAVRQLFGWLRSIQLGRVKPALRDKLRRYQAECDRVLWAHFVGSRLVAEQDLARERRITRQLQTQVLVAKPVWSAAMRLADAGYDRVSIRYQLRRSELEMTRIWQALEECGFTPPPHLSHTRPDIGDRDPVTRSH